MNWVAYGISAIDFGWEHLPTVQEAVAKIAAGEASRILHGPVIGDSPGMAVTEFLDALTNARSRAHAKGWEGDFHKGQEPRVCWLPAPHAFAYAFVWKQDNNGDTFVVSPIALPWLDDAAL